MQNTKDQHKKELASTQRHQIESQEIKNYIRSMSYGRDECESVARLESRVVFSGQLMRDTVKTTREQEKWIKLLLDDAKKTAVHWN